VATFDSTATRVVGIVGGSHFVQHSYFMLLPPIYGPLRADLGLTDPEFGLALGTLGLVVSLLQLPYGHLSDARSRSLVLAMSLGGGAVGAALVALAVDFRTLLLAQVVVGVGVAGHHSAHYPLIGAATDDATRGRAYSVHGFSGALGFATPPAVVAIAATLGFDWRVAVGAIAGVGALFGLFAVFYVRGYVDRSLTHASVADGAEVATEAGETMFEGVLRVFQSRPILALTTIWFVSSMAGWGIKQYAGPLLTDGYGIGPNAANLTVSAMLVIGAVSMFAGGWHTDRRSATEVLAASYLGLILIAGTLGFAVVPALGAVALTLLLSSTIDYNRPARAALADEFTGERSAGKTFSLVTLGAPGGAAIAPPILGVVVGAAGVGTAFLLIVGFAAGALGLVGVLRSLSSGA
jgi:predicted MFS family arabinose efflux permease